MNHLSHQSKILQTSSLLQLKTEQSSCHRWQRWKSELWVVETETSWDEVRCVRTVTMWRRRVPQRESSGLHLSSLRAEITQC